MGWSSLTFEGCDINADYIKSQGQALQDLGLDKLGYNYVNIDDCWQSMQRGDDGNLVADPSLFPNGIKDVADDVHDKGLKLGIFSNAGSRTCKLYPGSLGYEELDAKLFASFEADYLKYGNCNNEGVRGVDRYGAMS